MRSLKVFGLDGVKAVRTEIKQLHHVTAVKPKNVKELTAQERWEALAYLMFLKRKKTGQVKGCGWADWRKQRAGVHTQGQGDITNHCYKSCVSDGCD